MNKGKIAVFDGNFYWKSQIEDLISRLDSTWFAFTLKAPLEVCIKRDKKRSRSLGESAARTVFLKSSKFEYGLAIDVDKPVTKCLREILCRLPDC